MVAISEVLGWGPVLRPETSDLALGGNETNFPGRQLSELASRDKYLLDLVAPDETAAESFETFKQLGLAGIAQGRLTLLTDSPVPAAGQTARTTLYYTPYNGDAIALWNAVDTRWDLYTFTERSLSLSGLSANTNYDIFAYDSGGTVTLQAVAWSNSGSGSSTRASTLSLKNGVWVKTSDNRRYIGTIRITGTIGQCEDSVFNRYVWNAQNRVPRAMGFVATGSSYSYTTQAFRALNNSQTWQLRVVDGLGGQAATPMIQWESSTASGAGTFAGPIGQGGVGLNSTTINSAQINTTRPGVGDQLGLISIAAAATVTGYNYFQFLEFGGPSIEVNLAACGMAMTWEA